MMSLDAIRQMNQVFIDREKKRLHAYDGTKVYWTELPHIGWKRVAGFTETQTFFVDTSGFGEEGEPALTQEQFLSRVQVGRYYGFAEIGPFQAYIREFIKRERKNAPIA